MAKKLDIDWDNEPLGIFTDAELARQLDCSTTAVQRARSSREIKPSGSSGHSLDIDWNAQPLGQVSDAELARRLGCCQSVVGIARNKQGTPPHANTAPQSMMSRVFYTYRESARRRNLIFQLTKAELISLCEQNCHYCGGLPSRLKTRKRSRSRWIYNGIDRVDNTKGYTKKNTVPCCKDCNLSKLDRSVEEFTEWAYRLSAHLKKGK